MLSGSGLAGGRTLWLLRGWVLECRGLCLLFSRPDSSTFGVLVILE